MRLLPCGDVGLLVELDVRLGRREAVPAEVDPIRERFGDLGRDYEQQVTDELTATIGDGVVDAGRLRRPAGRRRP